MTDASAAAAEPAPHPQLPAAAYRNTALVLRIGLAIALAILLVALIAYLVQNPGASESSAVATNPIVGYLTGAGLVGGLASGAPAAYLTLGVYALVATPVARVLTGVYYFRQDRERAMAWITFSVLVLLLLGLFVIGPLIR
ncbi:MAG: DUF1634 domain-containing protein [Thermoplasmata archaeon]